MDTCVLVEAVRVADRLAQACKRTTVSGRRATQDWIIEIVGEAGITYYCAPVAAA